MASVQQAQGVAQINHDKEKAILSELVKEAQASLENYSDPEQLQYATVEGLIRNSQVELLKREKIHNWFGHFVAKPSEQIGKDKNVSFVHNAKSSNTIPPGGGPGPVIPVIGSKAAVIYGTTGSGVPRLGYLLAWYKAQNSDEHKVYVLAGELSKLLKLEWPEIEQKLDASGSESHSVDKETGATATAKITNLGAVNLAALGANFSSRAN